MLLNVSHYPYTPVHNNKQIGKLLIALDIVYLHKNNRLPECDENNFESQIRANTKQVKAIVCAVCLCRFFRSRFICFLFNRARNVCGCGCACHKRRHANPALKHRSSKAESIYNVRNLLHCFDSEIIHVSELFSFKWWLCRKKARLISIRRYAFSEYAMVWCVTSYLTRNKAWVKSDFICFPTVW